MWNRVVGCCLLLFMGLWVRASEPSFGFGPKVLPWVLGPDMLESLQISVHEEVWLELAYSATPEGSVMHAEVAEKVWWIQDRGLVILGGTGLPLPASITQRATIYVHVFRDGLEVPDSPFLLMPQRECVEIGPNVDRVREALAGRAAVDASYLSQVANFLAQNLSELAVQGTSYCVAGYSGVSGEVVINSSGQWTGEAVSRTTAWSEESTPADFLRAKSGGLARSGTSLYGNSADTHVNLGHNNATTGAAGLNRQSCTVGGGEHNEASHDLATVCGGGSNRASGYGSIVAGGWHNTASDYYGVAGGGYDNTVEGSYSVVPGGRENVASGSYAWVGGRNMNLDPGADHSFVWGYAESPQSLTASDSVLFFPKGITGKVGINMPNPTATLDVAGDVRSQIGGTNFYMVPEGAIIMWSGSLASIPSGWQLCDGSNGTPDLRNRFVCGVNDGENPGATGGQDSITLNTSQMPAHAHIFTTNPAGSHTHQIYGNQTTGGWDYASMMANNTGGFNVVSTAPDHVHTGTTQLAGENAPIENRPAYYKLAFIMKMP